MASRDPEEEVLVVVSDGLATLTLNRPKALNSLNVNMVERMSLLLNTWSVAASSGDANVVAIVVKGAGDKAFCAGGDVKWVVEQVQQGRRDGPSRFFTTEYRLNHQISASPVPYIALMDGVVMGGGAGVSVHGHFRIVTERTIFAMPECGIGLFPDIGSSFFLTRLPGQLGLWLGLTGARLEGVDVRAAGLATHYIPSHLLPEVESRLQRLAGSHAAHSRRPMDLSEINRLLCEIEEHAGPLPRGKLTEQLPWINQHFSNHSVSDILQSLSRRQAQLSALGQTAVEAAWLENTLKALGRGSPLSQRITYDLLMRARHMTLQACLQLDLKLVQKFVLGRGDFEEGVRATLVERGRQPLWKYASVHEVPEQVVQSFFEDLSNL